MKADIYTPADLDADTPPALSDYGWRLLAEGDSWFSLTVTGRYGSNLLQELRLPRRTAIVNCAAPGDTLQRMVDRRADGRCERLLCAPRLARAWDAVLLSAGGNDLIAAAATPLVDAAGVPTPAERRLLRSLDEVGHASQANDWLSDAGWTRLADHLRAGFATFVYWRDSGPSAGRPLLLHTTPRRWRGPPAPGWPCRAGCTPRCCTMACRRPGSSRWSSCCSNGCATCC